MNRPDINDNDMNLTAIEIFYVYRYRRGQFNMPDRYLVRVEEYLRSIGEIK